MKRAALNGRRRRRSGMNMRGTAAFKRSNPIQSATPEGSVAAASLNDGDVSAAQIIGSLHYRPVRRGENIQSLKEKNSANCL